MSEAVQNGEMSGSVSGHGGELPEGWHRPPQGGLLMPPWQKGVSNNPGGRASEYSQVMRLARDASPKAIEKLVHLMETSTDERVALVAAEKILERAWGKPKDTAPANERAKAIYDLSKLTVEDMKAMLNLLQSARRESEGQVIEGEAEAG